MNLPDTDIDYARSWAAARVRYEARYDKYGYDCPDLMPANLPQLFLDIVDEVESLREEVVKLRSASAALKKQLANATTRKTHFAWGIEVRSETTGEWMATEAYTTFEAANDAMLYEAEGSEFQYRVVYTPPKDAMVVASANTP